MECRVCLADHAEARTLNFDDCEAITLDLCEACVAGFESEESITGVTVPRTVGRRHGP